MCRKRSNQEIGEPMIDILNENWDSKTIKKSVNNDKLTLSFSRNSTVDGYLNVDDCAQSQIEIICDEEANIKIVQIGSKNANFNVILKEKSCLKLEICSLDSSNKRGYKFDLFDSANLLCAYADFCTGIEDIDVLISLKEPNARALWHLASLAGKNDQKTMKVSFDHCAVNTYSEMNNYGVCKDASKISFLGTSKIENKASKSAAHQNARIMVFDEKCRAEADPILCIDENDVEASHAAVVGKINEDHLFYLCSRGLSEEDAKRLITLGYLNPIIEYFDDQRIKEDIANAIIKKV